MKQYSKSLAALIFTITFLSSALIHAQVTLRVGDNAPQFKAGKWFKGTPITGFEKGKIYVVEFWATWCSPCKKNIPRLTELAHKYNGKVTIIGMDGSEDAQSGQDPNKLVEDFVKEMGDKMDYNVAMDSEERFMSNNWMTAAVQLHIPTAFIVDNDTKISWIGHPMNMEEPLAKIVDGTFDVKAYAAKFGVEQDKIVKENAERKKFDEISKPIIDAYKANDFAKVVTESEALAAKDPSLQDRIDPYYFKGLIQANPDKLFAMAQAEKAKDSERLMNMLSLFGQKGLDKKFYNYAIATLTPKIEKDANDYASLSALESIYEALSNNAKAIEMIDKMLVYAKANGAPEDYIKQMNDKIAELKEAK